MTYRCYEDIKGQASAWKAALRVVDERTLVVTLGSRRGARHEDQVLAELSRGSRVLKLALDSDRSSHANISEIGVGPEIPEHALGMLYLPLLQMLAYHRAVHRGESNNLTSYVELSSPQATFALQSMW